VKEHKSFAGERVASKTRVSEGEVSERHALVEEFADIVPLLAKGLKVQLNKELRQELRELTVHQMEALAALEQQSLTMSELCFCLDISESAGTALIDKLAARGLVHRSADAEDRRVVRVEMSEQAKKMVRRYRELRREQVQKALEVLDLETLRSFVEICKEIVSSQSASDAGEEPGIRQHTRCAKEKVG
jgi:DNA-binding MarR family transcriptional regulator